MPTGIMGAPEVPPLCRETSVSRTANVGTVGKNWLRKHTSQRGVQHFDSDDHEPPAFVADRSAGAACPHLKHHQFYIYIFFYIHIYIFLYMYINLINIYIFIYVYQSYKYIYFIYTYIKKPI